jgi:hypothetical protein
MSHLSVSAVNLYSSPSGSGAVVVVPASVSFRPLLISFIWA